MFSQEKPLIISKAFLVLVCPLVGLTTHLSYSAQNADSSLDRPSVVAIPSLTDSEYEKVFLSTSREFRLISKRTILFPDF